MLVRDIQTLLSFFYILGKFRNSEIKFFVESKKGRISARLLVFGGREMHSELLTEKSLVGFKRLQ